MPFSIGVPQVTSCVSTCLVHRLNPCAGSQFSAAFKDSLLYLLYDSYLDVECLITLFNNTCSEISDSVGPLRSKHPWLKDTTRFLRGTCRITEKMEKG